ncbi:hypothetical protein [Nocardiopsis trehalosi]|uniref:hypothetical protein n=1 Tax=Nocardiopsis trehalosi TaxID=109329 RepID=UPI00082B34AB|nr:hypothetical protein [Nocardiopsis trehalosi]
MRARETFAVGQRVVAAGQELADDDPIVTGHPQFFETATPAAGAPEPRAKRRRPRGEDPE